MERPGLRHRYDEPKGKEDEAHDVSPSGDPIKDRRWSIDRIGISSLLMSNSQNAALSLVIIASYFGRNTYGSVDEQEAVAVANDSSLQSLYQGAYAITYYCVTRLLVLYPIGVQLWRGIRYFLREGAAARADILLTRVTSSQTMTRIRSTVSSSSVRNLMSLCHLHQADRSLVISAKEPFLPLDVIEQLTLSDITDLFRYTVEVRRPKFDRAAFISTLPSNSTLVLRGVLDVMDQVTTESSGGACLVTVRESSDDGSRRPEGEASNEDIDALFFCAATRIFAEWRSVRLVPPNCNSRYGIGMNLARRDLVQNIHKVESAAHSWLVHHLQRTAPMSCRPTIRQILEFELQQPNLHARLPRLTDKSGASGILWIKRQLSYQTRLFDNIAQIPYRFDGSKSAVTAAYQATYHAYHGFFVKQIFQSSFEAAPDAQTILQYMNLPASLSTDTETVAEDHEWSDIEEDGDAGGPVSEDDDAWVQLPVDETDEASPQAERDASTEVTGEAATYLPPAEMSNPLESIGGLLEEHMAKLQKFVGQCIGVQVDSNPHRNVMEAQVGGLFVNEQVCAKNEAMHTVSNVIPTYLAVLQPVLETLDRMLHELNMNDPTKI